MSSASSIGVSQTWHVRYVPTRSRSSARSTVVQRRLDGVDALVVGLWHAMNLLAPVPIAKPNRLKGTTTGVAASFCRDR